MTYHWINENLLKALTGDDRHVFHLSTSKISSRYTAETNMPYFEESHFEDEGKFSAEHITLFVPEKASIKPIVHEMGHHIGIRNRITRAPILIQLVIYAFLNEILAIYNMKKEKRMNMRRDIRISKKEVNELLKLLSDIFVNCKTIIENNMGYVKCKVEKYTELDPDCLFSDRIVAEASIWVYTILKNVVNDVASKEETKDVKAKIDISILKSSVSYVLEQFNKYKTFETLETLQYCISEPTADCFMISVCGMNFDEYLDLLLEYEWKTWKEQNASRNKRVDFNQYANNSAFMIRLLTIYHSFYKAGSKGCVDIKYKRFYILRRKRDIAEFKKQLNPYFERTNEIMEIEKNSEDYIQQNIINPLPLIADYIALIYEANMDDIRKSKGERKNAIKTIRKHLKTQSI